jgi:hypothetical protein
VREGGEGLNSYSEVLKASLHSSSAYFGWEERIFDITSVCYVVSTQAVMDHLSSLFDLRPKGRSPLMGETLRWFLDIHFLDSIENGAVKRETRACERSIAVLEIMRREGE